MLHARLNLLSKYLSSLPPSYLSDASLAVSATPESASQTPISHTILRTLQSTLSRLPLVVPPSSASDPASSTFAAEALSERSDVALVQLLSSLTESVSGAKEMGRKSAIVDTARAIAARPGGFPQIGISGGGGEGWDGMGSPDNFGGPLNIMSMLSARTAPG